MNLVGIGYAGALVPIGTPVAVNDPPAYITTDKDGR